VREAAGVDETAEARAGVDPDIEQEILDVIGRVFVDRVEL
jgi:hypothetical protein